MISDTDLLTADSNSNDHDTLFINDTFMITFNDIMIQS